MSAKLINAPKPGTEQWMQTVTASKIGAIMGVNPYETIGDMWAKMSGKTTTPPLEDNARLTWGHVAEDALVKFWLTQNPGWVDPGNGEETWCNDEIDFPHFVTLDRLVVNPHTGESRVLECKTSDNSKMWETLPLHVYYQVQFQLGVTGVENATVIAQVGSTVPQFFDVQLDKDVFNALLDGCRKFYGHIKDGTPPVYDHTELMLAAPDITAPGTDVVDVAEQGHVLIELLRVQAQLNERVESTKKNLIQLAGYPKKILVDGETLLSARAGRFSKTRLPADMSYIADLDTVTAEKVTRRLDTKKLKTLYPDVYEAGLGEPEYSVNPHILNAG